MKDLVNNLFRFFNSGSTNDYSFRLTQLKRLRIVLKEYENELILALQKDLNKPYTEAYASEIDFVYSEISYMERHLKRFIKPQKVSSPLKLFYSKSYIYSVPLGVVLIIAPWNYPVQLLLSPLIGAIAGGNCIVLKPSEFTPTVSLVLKKVIDKSFDPNYIILIEGDGAHVVPELIKQNDFNHVFFTGSTIVGREIAKECSNKLIPYTLELGGKSPAIIDSNVDLKVACKRIAWAKFYNSGQTCIAPDYILVDQKIKDDFIKELKLIVDQFYANTNYARIINKKRFSTLVNYIKDSKVIYGGKYNEENLYIEPTLVDSPSIENAIMHDEIFGPILPIIGYSSIEEMQDIISKNQSPLALYVFSKNKVFANKIINDISFGGGGVNIALLHIINSNLPFGGVGNSGQGSYHGKYSFDTFTHKKSIVKMSTCLDAFFKYPPYTKFKSFLLKMM